METPALAVFILAKNEAANLARTLAPLATTGWPVTILDSSSTDDTAAIAAAHPFVRLQPFTYTTHHAAYNAITTTLADTPAVIILDADMVLSQGLIAEVQALITSHLPGSRIPIARAPVAFCVEGQPLKHASLYPPKPFLFPTGQPWFVQSGHAERVRDDVPVHQFHHSIAHDDRKPFASFLAGQARYSQNFVDRLATGEVTSRDRFRARWPLMIFAVPLVSFLARFGLLDGRAGRIYALDKLIAEAIMHRQALAARLRKDLQG